MPRPDNIGYLFGAIFLGALVGPSWGDLGVSAGRRDVKCRAAGFGGVAWRVTVPSAGLQVCRWSREGSKHEGVETHRHENQSRSKYIGY